MAFLPSPIQRVAGLVFELSPVSSILLGFSHAH